MLLGNEACAEAAVYAGLDFFAGYPITPASDILHELSRHKHFGVRTFQAEDEIAGVGSAIGAAFGGVTAFTATSGPGLALMTESIGLAVASETPLTVLNGCAAARRRATRPT